MVPVLSLEVSSLGVSTFYPASQVATTASRFISGTSLHTLPRQLQLPRSRLVKHSLRYSSTSPKVQLPELSGDVFRTRSTT